MAEPAWKPPTGTQQHLAPEEPVLQRWVRRPDGRLELHEFLLTSELFLDPQLEDKMVQGTWHDVTCRDLMSMLESHFRSLPEVQVFHDLKHFLLPGLPAPAPDVSVIHGIGPKKRQSFEASKEGGIPSLVIEVVSPASPEVRRTDLEDKLLLYRLAGIPEYLIVDSMSAPGSPPADWSYTLRGYRKREAGWYQPVELDAQGRFLSATTDLWFQVAPDGQRILVYESPSGRRLLSSLEQAVRADEAEAEALQAKQQALRDAEARQAAEEKLARLQAELDRLQRGG
jgi:Uma2 family endonuclease